MDAKVFFISLVKTNKPSIKRKLELYIYCCPYYFDHLNFGAKYKVHIYSLLQKSEK